jgi:hypothetical protein
VAEVCVLVRGHDGLVRAECAWRWDGRAAKGSPGPAWTLLLGLLGEEALATSTERAAAL